MSENCEKYTSLSPRSQGNFSKFLVLSDQLPNYVAFTKLFTVATSGTCETVNMLKHSVSVTRQYPSRVY